MWEQNTHQTPAVRRVRTSGQRNAARTRITHPRCQSGAIAIMFALILIPLIGVCALAIDLGLVYNRKAEMRNIAHAIALGAAKQLNGTPGGVTNALAAAANIATVMKFKNHKESVSWSAAAVKFSSSPSYSASWSDAAGASATAERMYYVKVDTSAFGTAGVVSTFLAPVLDASLATVASNSAVIAGRLGIDLAPLAVCAMSATPASARSNSASYVELVEYGFRRGVSYDLMNLNPIGTQPLNFTVNPVAQPGSSGTAADTSAAALSPFVCTGTLGIPRVTGDQIAVTPQFPLASLYRQLNSRFDQYDSGLCTPQGALPDVNVKAYEYTKMPSPIPWMTKTPAAQTAASTTTRGKLETVADLPAPGGTAEQYGPLWAFAKAVPYSAYTAGALEPAAGYTPFTTASWPTLYGTQSVRTYPAGSATPYKPGAGVNLAAPSSAHGPGLRGRRILNVPLLSCTTAPSTTAKVVAIGKFFMTVPATPTALAAEFGGIVPFERISGNVGVFQ